MMALVKIVISSVIIAFVSWLAGKKPVLAGFLVALPVVSILSLIFAYLQYRDMEKINTFAISILTAIPLSLLFFLPFLFNRWLKFNFPVTVALGIGCLAVAYVIHSFIFKTGMFR